MPKTPEFILLAAPWKASVPGCVFPLGLPEPDGLVGDVPLAAGKAAALPGTLLPVTPLSKGLLAGALFAGPLLPEEAPLAGAPLPAEAPLAGAPLAALAETPLPDEPLAGAPLPAEAPLPGAPLPGDAALAETPLPDEPLAGPALSGDPLAWPPLSTGDCGLAVWLGLTGSGTIDIVKVWTSEALAGDAAGA